MQHQPDRLREFEKYFECLQEPDFRTLELPKFLDENQLSEIKAHIAGIEYNRFNKEELFQFGRLILHDDPYFTTLQSQLTEQVSTWVGEAVEPCYNFLSLYNNLGICEPHMDSPSAKWTVDICIDQSDIWPIYISEPAAWPLDLKFSDEWQQEIKAANSFTQYDMQPGDAVIFTGANQWHYRERIHHGGRDNFCHLIFLHYIPQGYRDSLNPKNWAKDFDLPCLETIALDFIESGYESY